MREGPGDPAVEGVGPWVTAFGWLLVALAAPLAFSTQAAATFFTVKLGPLYVGAALVAIGAAWPPPRKRTAPGAPWRGPLRVEGAELLALGFLLLGLVSVAFASSRVTALLGTYNQGTGWLFWAASLGVWFGLRRGRIDSRLAHVFLVGFVAVASIVAVLAVLQALRWEPLHFRLGFRADGRVGSTLGNPLYLGTYLSLAVVALLHLWTDTRAWLWRLVGALAACALLAGVAFTWSRGSWLAVAAGVLVWGVGALIADRASWRRVTAAAGAAVVVAAMAAFVVAPAVAPARVGDQAPPAVADPADSAGTSTVETRLLIWGAALDAIRERPVVGWGPNNFRFAALRYTTEEKLELEPNTRDGDAHMLPLELAATWGVAATILLTAWGLFIVYEMWRRRRDPRVALASGALAAFIVGSLTMPQNLIVTPVALGLLAFAPGRWAADPEVLEGPGGRSVSVRAIRGGVLRGRWAAVLRASVLTVACAGLLATAAGSWLWYRADVHYQAGEIRGDLDQLTLAVDTFPLVDAYLYSLGVTEGRLGYTGGRAVLTSQAVSHLREGMRLSPHGVEFLVALSGVYLQVADWQQAAAVGRQAVEMAPTEPQAHANLAYALLRQGDRVGAEEAAQQALAVDVGSPRILNTVGLYYRDAGDVMRAQDLFNEALRIDPGFSPARDNLDSLVR